MKSRIIIHVVGYTTVGFLALAATAQALPGTGTVDSGDIINGEVRAVDIGGSAVSSPKVGDGTLQGVDIANNNLTGVDIKDGALGPADLAAGSVTGTKVLDGSLTGADITDSSVLGTDLTNGTVTGSDLANGTVTGFDIAGSTITGSHVASNSLTGSDINEAALSYSASGCQIGLVHSFARVKGAAGMPGFFTTSSTWVDVVHTCPTTSDAAFVRRVTTGVYEVIFSGDPAVLAMATVHGGDGDNDNTVAVQKLNSTTFQVVVRDQSGALDDGWFQIMTF